MEHATILWKRIDGPGADACRLEVGPRGARLEGTALLRINGAPARLDYTAVCDRRWRTRAGRVAGWIGQRFIEISVRRTISGRWTLDGVNIRGLRDCIDLDYGFTPATNLFQLRRIGL